jgi:hypothetical protein
MIGDHAGVGGFDYELRCAGCRTVHAVRTGFSRSFSFEQQICHRCEAFVSVPVEEEIVPGPCRACGLQLEPWRGRVWRDERGDERLEGPCPRCFAVLTQEDALSRRAWS